MEKYLRRFINIYIKIFASTISDRITVCTRLSGHFAVSLRVLQELTLSVALLHPTFRQYSLFIPLYFLKYIPIVRETHDKKFESSRPAMCIKCAWQNLTGKFQVRHPRCVDKITSIDNCSQTQLLTFRRRNFLLNFSTPVFKM